MNRQFVFIKYVTCATTKFDLLKGTEHLHTHDGDWWFSDKCSGIFFLLRCADIKASMWLFGFSLYFWVDLFKRTFITIIITEERVHKITCQTDGCFNENKNVCKSCAMFTYVGVCAGDQRQNKNENIQQKKFTALFRTHDVLYYTKMGT